MSLFMMKGADSPMARLAMLIVAVAALGGAMRYLALYSNPGAAGRDYLQMLNSDIECADPEAGGKPFAQLTADQTLYHSTQDELQSVERSRGARALADVQRPLLMTAQWVKGRPQGWLAEQALDRGAWHNENIVREPSRWRMLPMHVYGVLAEQNVIEYPDNPPGLRKLFWLTLYDPTDAVFFTVLTPQAPRGRKVMVQAAEGRRGERGTYLAFDGIYLMAFPFMTAGGTQDMPLFYAPSVEAASEGRTPPPLLDGRGGRPVAGEGANKPLRSVPGLDVAFLRSRIYSPPKNGDGNAQYRSLANDLRAEKPALVHIYEYLAGVPAEDLRQMAQNPEVSYVALMEGDNAPGWTVGQATGFTGVVFSVDTLRFPAAQDGIDRIYLVTAGDLHYQKLGEYTWVVAVRELPAGLRRGDRIAAEGIYLKLYPYPTQNNQWHWSPLLVADTVRPVALPYSPFLPAFVPEHLWPWIGAAAGLLVVAGGVWLWLRGRADNQKIEQIKRQLRGAPVKGRFGVGKRTAVVLRSRRQTNGATEPLPSDGAEERGDAGEGGTDAADSAAGDAQELARLKDDAMVDSGKPPLA